MRLRHLLVGNFAAALMTLPLAAQTATPAPVLSSIQSPYPAVQSQVTMPPGSSGSAFARGTVSYGPAGTPLVLSGKDFGGGGSILFPVYGASGTIPGIVTSWSESIIFVKVPSGAGAGAVYVVSDEGKSSNALPFIVTPGTYSASCAQFPANSQFQITTSSLPNGTANQSYSVTLSASGGASPYNWSLTGSQLPAGLSLNSTTGVISGTPTSGAGPLTLNVEATDSSSPKLASDAVLDLTVDSPTLTSATVYSYSAGYDHVGNVTSYNDQMMGQWTFTYDDLNRLASGTPSTGVYSGQNQQLCFAYDSFGNRTQADFQTTACKPGTDLPTATYLTNNRVNTTSAGVFSYDAAGNVTFDGNNSYAYDGEGRLCAVQTSLYSGGTVAYGYMYDAEGRRVAKGSINVSSTPLAPSVCNPSTNGFQLTESYVLGQGGEQLTTLNGSGAWRRTNVYSAGQLIATYDAAGLHFQLTDPLGTRRVQTNSAGEAELDCQSLPFGDQQNCFPDPSAPDNDPDADATGTQTSIHFTGKERDVESGNDYFGARYYSSNMGRFMSPDDGSDQDPGNPQSWNLYSYVRNNPLNNADPSGNVCVVNDDGSHTDDSTIPGETCEEVESANATQDVGYVVNGGPVQQMDEGQATPGDLGMGFYASGALGGIAFKAALGTLGVVGGGPSTVATTVTATIGLSKLTPAEQQIVAELTAAGNTVTPIARGAGKTADFLVNGVETELKTLTTAGPNTLKNAIESAASQSSQNILIDARNVNINASDVVSQIQRAQGNVGNLSGRVTVLTKGGAVSY